MLMETFMKTRESIRDFKDKKIKEKDLEELQEIIGEINQKANECQVSFLLEEDGKNVVKALEGQGGYAGVMIHAPAYIAMDILDEGTPDAYIYGAYYMEDLITKLQEVGLGSCWVSLHDATDACLGEAFSQKRGYIHFALAIGYPYPKLNFGEKVFSSRLGLEEFVYHENFDTPAKVEVLESYGLDDLFYYLRYAPSTKNRQPWRFLLLDSEIDLYVEDFQGNTNYVDAGIVMYYYTRLAQSTGIQAQWKDHEKEDMGNKKYIASVNF